MISFLKRINDNKSRRQAIVICAAALAVCLSCCIDAGEPARNATAEANAAAAVNGSAAAGGSASPDSSGVVAAAVNGSAAAGGQEQQAEANAAAESAMQPAEQKPASPAPSMEAQPESRYKDIPAPSPEASPESRYKAVAAPSPTASPTQSTAQYPAQSPAPSPASNSASSPASSTVTAPSPVPATSPEASPSPVSSPVPAHSPKASPSPVRRPSPAAKPSPAPPDVYELAFISDFGLIGDGSITQAAWDGLERYASDHRLNAKHYLPDNQSVGAYLKAIRGAAEGGAKLIVTAGVLWEEPIWLAQTQYAGVNFLLVDGTPHNGDYADETIRGNVAAIRFDAAEAGFLAGYAAVKAGCRRVGFIGAMPAPEIADTGLGFIQGAEYAAQELNLPEGGVQLRYAYAGTYMARSEAQMLAREWFGEGGETPGGNADAADAAIDAGTGAVTGAETDAASGAGGAKADGAKTDGAKADGAGATGGANAAGGPPQDADSGEAADENDGGGAGAGTELIYAAGGEMERRVALAAERAGRRVIIYDNAGAKLSPSVAATVQKNYGDAVYDCVSRFYLKKFPGGAVTVYGAREGGVGLRFADAEQPPVTQSEYVKILSALAGGAIGIVRSQRNPYVPPAADALPTVCVTVLME